MIQQRVADTYKWANSRVSAKLGKESKRVPGNGQ